MSGAEPQSVNLHLNSPCCREAPPFLQQPPFTAANTEEKMKMRLHQVVSQSASHQKEFWPIRAKPSVPPPALPCSCSSTPSCSAFSPSPSCYFSSPSPLLSVVQVAAAAAGGLKCLFSGAAAHLHTCCTSCSGSAEDPVQEQDQDRE